MSRDVNVSGGGIGFLGLLTVVFITLKLIGTIAWSWWWVLAPVWMPIALCALIFIALGTIAVAINDC